MSVDLVVCRKVEIPYVEAMDQVDAQTLITAAGLAVQIAGYVYDCMMAPEGHVHMQDPRGGWVCPTTTVYLTISLGGRPVPDVVGMTQAAAESAINNPDYPCNGCSIEVGAVSYEHNNTVPEGHVISQSIAAGVKICGIVEVNLTVSLGPAPANEPPVASDLSLTPVSPTTLNSLSGSYTYSDADGDPESGTEIRWYRSGSLQTAYNDQLSIPSSATSVGQNWNFTVEPKDGTDFGTLKTSPTVTIHDVPSTTVVVPNVVGMSETEANSAITSAGLYASYSYEYSDAVPGGYVIGQNPSGGTSVPEGSDVDLTISRGPQQPGEDPPIPGQPVAACLVAHWKLDEGFGNTAIDSSGNGFDITLHNTTWEDGVFGGAAHFQGVGYGNVSNINCNDNAITVCAWVFHDEFRTYRIERYVTVSEPSVAVIRKEYDGRLHFYIGTDGNFRHLLVDDVLTEG